MPLYEYQCKECGRRTEKIQKFSDEPLTVCPHCGGPIERTLTAPAIQFKGGGWYKDLYSSAKPVAANSGETKSGDSAKSGESAAPAASSSSTSEASGTASNSSGSSSSGSTSTPAASSAKS